MKKGKTTSFQVSEEELKKFRSGDRRVQERIVTNLQRKTEWLVEKKLGKGNPHAEDLVMEILAVIVGNLLGKKYNTEKGDLGGYVHTIARNKIVDFLKGPQYQKRQDKISIDDPKVRGVITGAGGHLPDPPPVDIEEAELKEYLAKQIEQLPDKYKKIIYMSFYEDCKVAKIGRRLNLPPQKVSNDKSYGLKLLKDALEEICQYL